MNAFSEDYSGSDQTGTGITSESKPTNVATTSPLRFNRMGICTHQQVIVEAETRDLTLCGQNAVAKLGAEYLSQVIPVL